MSNLCVPQKKAKELGEYGYWIHACSSAECVLVVPCSSAIFIYK